MSNLVSSVDDLLDRALLQDPYTYRRELREERPVFWYEPTRYPDMYAGRHHSRTLADTVMPYFLNRMSPESRERLARTYEVLNS